MVLHTRGGSAQARLPVYRTDTPATSASQLGCKQSLLFFLPIHSGSEFWVAAKLGLFCQFTQEVSSLRDTFFFRWIAAPCSLRQMALAVFLAMPELTLVSVQQTLCVCVSKLHGFPFCSHLEAKRKGLCWGQSLCCAWFCVLCLFGLALERKPGAYRPQTAGAFVPLCLVCLWLVWPNRISLEPDGSGGQNRFGIPFWGGCTTHFCTFFSGWIGIGPCAQRKGGLFYRSRAPVVSCPSSSAHVFAICPKGSQKGVGISNMEEAVGGCW